MITDTTICNAISYTWGTNDMERVSTLLQGMWLLTIETDDYAIVEDIDFLQEIARLIK